MFVSLVKYISYNSILEYILYIFKNNNIFYIYTRIYYFEKKLMMIILYSTKQEYTHTHRAVNTHNTISHLYIILIYNGT